MKTLPSDDGDLGKLLRESRPMPDLPPGFQNAVWRRLEQSIDRPAVSRSGIEILVSWLLRPRHALIGAAMLVLVGVTIGLVEGGDAARDLARARYVNAVSPALTR